jgi:hypothetical protein
VDEATLRVMILAKLIFFLFGLGLGALAVLVWSGFAAIPPAWNPLGPPDLAAETGPFTRLQLAGLRHEPATCFDLLEQAGIRVSPAAERVVENGCGIQNAAYAEKLDIAYSRGFVATCPMLAALIVFERQVVQPAALRHFGMKVIRIGHLGSYSCRNIYGRETGRRSEHATANAIDIAAFTLTDGRVVSLARNWNRGGAGAAFLREVDDGACRLFNVVLGPDYNAAHRDHFHLDMGRFRVCR